MILVLAAALSAPSATAQKKKKKRKRVEHVEQENYSSPGLGLSNMAQEDTQCLADASLGCVDLPLKPKDRFVTVEVDDALSPTVAGYVYQYQGDTFLTHEHFCGETPGPISILKDADRVGVFIETGPCSDLTAATATSGTVTATLWYMAKPKKGMRG